MATPRRPTAPELAKVGIRLVKRKPLILQCQQCGAEWHRGSLRLRRPYPYWRCTNGCNADISDANAEADPNQE